ncbi:cupin domain-containing protein [Terriglobus saanensis]|uniref:Cupin 2 conserved barrel domain protein n=1 Tax=Terriglobus saanensis (strain ATCC BAA-1853 / DSM 23119 / SP1PR4) TaxID=401053 RepID=E8UYU6_TERSS|nr:cupin domain-containing protein [Terriglobus saanensis]ADV84312.1 Cupin 2 conserved barrel domain protein [Terriglobus saanensis SP1PR4]
MTQAAAGETLSEQETLSVMGVLVRFIATPEEVDDVLGAMHGTIPPGVFIPLHSHPDAEILYVLKGSIEVYQEAGASSEWRTMQAGSTISIPRNAKHAFRNTSSQPVTAIVVIGQELYRFFREIARSFDPSKPPAPPTAEEREHFFKVVARYGYWLGSAEENAAIGLMLQ